MATVVAKLRNTFLLRLQHSQRQLLDAARCCVAHHQFHLPVAVEVVVDAWHRGDSSSAPLGFVRDSEFSSFSLLRSVSCASRGFAAMAEPTTTQQSPEQGVSSSRAAESESEVADVSGSIGGDRREEPRSAAGAPEESAAAAGADEAGEEVAAAPRRYAVLTTGHSAEYCQRVYGGYGPLFVKLLKDPGEIWDEILVIEGQFPTAEDLDKYDGFVVTGSRHDAHGEEEWIERLCGILKQIHEKQKKLLGVCFGHQVLSRALGGKTGRADGGWEVGLRDVNFSDAFFDKPYATGVPTKIKIFEVHRDQHKNFEGPRRLLENIQFNRIPHYDWVHYSGLRWLKLGIPMGSELRPWGVLELPPGAELLASSEQTGIEMYSVGEHTLAIQGHPEFFDDVVDDLLEGRLKAFLTEEEIKKAKETMKSTGADQNLWQQICKDFLRGSNS